MLSAVRSETPAGQSSKAPGSTPSGGFFTIRGADVEGLDTKLRFGEQQSSNQISGKQMTETNRLRIAMQKSGRLSDDSQDLLERCGLKVRYHAQRLLAMAENMPVEILRVRDDDIPGLVMDGVVDLGIIGENVLEETVLARRSQGQSTDFRMLRRFDFGGCRLSIAIPADQEWAGLESLDGCRIATSYPQLLKRCFDERGLTFKPCLLTGSVEVAPRAGLADAICDLVSSARRLKRTACAKWRWSTVRRPASSRRASRSTPTRRPWSRSFSCACRASQGPANASTSCCTPRRRSSPK